jgi:uncharacterized protein YndB with AHSA1/START domain
MSNCAQLAATTRSDTRSVTIEAPPSVVFGFVADPANLPYWAVGFCRSIRPDERDRWLVTTASGEIAMRYESNETAGTIDFRFSPGDGIEAAAFSRVVSNGHGSEYIFTQFQLDGMPNDVFEGQIRALEGELQVLRGLIKARTACRM